MGCRSQPERGRGPAQQVSRCCLGLGMWIGERKDDGGGAVWLAISRTISSVNAPVGRRRPPESVTLALRTTSSSEWRRRPTASSPQHRLWCVPAAPGRDGYLRTPPQKGHGDEGVDALAGLLLGQTGQALFRIAAISRSQMPRPASRSRTWQWSGLERKPVARTAAAACRW